MRTWIVVLGIIAIAASIASAIISAWVASKLNDKHNKPQRGGVDLTAERNWSIVVAILNVIIAIHLVLMLVIALTWKPPMPTTTYSTVASI